MTVPNKFPLCVVLTFIAEIRRSEKCSPNAENCASHHPERNSLCFHMYFPPTSKKKQDLKNIRTHNDIH